MAGRIPCDSADPRWNSKAIRDLIESRRGDSKDAEFMYEWEPGPRVDGSWYVCVLRPEKRVEKRSLAIGFRRG